MGAVGLLAVVTAALAAVTGIAPRPEPARLHRILAARSRTRDDRARTVAPALDAPQESPAEPGISTPPRIVAVAAAVLGGAMVLGGTVGAVVGIGCGVAVWFWTGRLESAKTVRDREQITASVPLAAELLAAAMAAGCPPGPAAEAVGAALPGQLGARLGGVAGALRVGTEPSVAWRSIGSEPGLRSLGRAMADASARGVSPVVVLERIARDAEDAARWSAEARARAVGARAAVPLGLCFLPAFVLIGIVPMIATSISFLP
jgi:Flp pilus assembly protein TadB